MGKILLAADTSAIISLSLTGKFHLIKKDFYLNSPMRVKIELKEIAEQKDEIGRVAQSILNSNIIRFHKLPSSLQSNTGELETVTLANELKAEAIVMDDIKSMKKLENKTNIPIWFSSFVIFTLCGKKILTYKGGWSAIEDMKTKRGWKENLIIDYAKLLFEQAEK